MSEQDLAATDTMRDPEEPRSSELILSALNESKKEFQPYWDYCDLIDKLVGAVGTLQVARGDFFTDQEFDLFWASLEILKPATYCKPPQAVVAPRFADRNKVASVASELLERCINSTFEREDFDETMLEVRDDLIIAARGVIRSTYEDGGKKGKRVCNDQVDRKDFLHEPARKWQEVGWVAFAAYLDKKAFGDRFKGVDADKAQYNVRRDKTDNTLVDTVAKCKVWEVWHRADDKVYWVTEGVETVLDEKKPFIDLEKFFPCPRPAYGTRRRRSLIPVPDYVRYERTLEQINTLTSRVYNLLEWIKVKGLIPAGGDTANAVETAMANSEDDVLLIPVPAVALMKDGGGNLVQFLPLQEFAATVTELLNDRRELINNFYELSGISDIMRGATEAEETLGAQQLKSQYGSVRVREKIDELQRIARDSARITAEILAEKFDQETLLAMSQMEIPTKADLKNRIKELEDGAKKELDALEKQAQAAMEQAQASGQQIDPQQAEQQFNQAQQEIIGRTQAQLQQIAKEVPIEDVMSFLRDQKTRAFAIDIETDSTVMTDELAEKQARGEFLTAFAGASTAVQPLLMAGEPGAKLAGAMLKFSLAPFRAGRELDGLIDDFVDAAPSALAQQGGNEGEAALAEANMQLAQAELKKAEAAIAKVQVDAQSKQQEMQLKAAEAQAKAQEAQQKLALELEQTRGSIAETEARIEKIMAEIQKMGIDASNQTRQQTREDVKTVADIQMRQTDQAMNAQDRQRQAIESERNAQMGERQQSFSEQQASRGEDRADRQQDFAERQAQREGAE